MLSRTAYGLFWMSRYIERAENVARLLDTGRRMDALPSTADARHSEWRSIVIASGCRSTYPHPLDEATADTVADHLIFDRDNPPSIASCLHAARENARAMRIAITTEVWDAINESWSEMRATTPDQIRGSRFAGFLEWVKRRGSLMRGAADSTMLRDSGYSFIQLGKHIERADATARILDVKYHVLLPKAQDVGGGLDHMQWVMLLRAANCLRSFRWQYRQEVTPPAVTDLLLFNPQTPRSFRFCYQEIVKDLERIGTPLPAQRTCLDTARGTLAMLTDSTADKVIAEGLHEWITDRIVETNQLAQGISEAYGFTGPIPAVSMLSQSQGMTNGMLTQPG